MKNKILAAIFAAASFLSVASYTTEASAQATRTWVSGVGDDVNPCSRTAPCKTFAGAISKTADGGIIDTLDPGGFGAVTITKSITIRGTGTNASLLVAGTNAVVINAPGKTVNLVDLQIDGVGAGGAIGVNVIAATQVTIQNCLISGFRSGAATGVKVASNPAARVLIKDSFLFNNSVGIDYAPPAGAGAEALLIENSVINDSPTAALRGNSASAVFLVRRSSMVQNIVLTNGATVVSTGDNLFSSAFTPNTTLPLK